MNLSRQTLCIVHCALCIAASAASAATLEPNSRIEIDAVISNGHNVAISLGRGREGFQISARDNAYTWNFTDSVGHTPSARPYPGSSRPEERISYWWERVSYTPNGRYRRSFATPPAIAAASEAMMGERWMTADNRHLTLAVELSDGWLSFFVDDILFHALPATADVAGRELSVTPTRGAALSEPKTVPVKPANGYWRVPLGRAATKPGNPLGEAGRSGDGQTEFGQRGAPGAAEAPGQIPFLPCDRSVEVGRSWVRELCVDEWGEPQSGVFGGRWAGALSATPCRLQFRVPNRPYDAVYLLASCVTNNFLTVQFYRPGSGFPIDCVPAEPIATDGKVQVIRVPVRQDQLATFADREVIEMELTGRVHNYNAYPEPLHYSRHGAGEPSGVVVHAITLHEAPLEIDFKPEAFGNVWVGNPSLPAYLLTLRNATATARKAALSIETRSYDGGETNRSEAALDVPPNGSASIRLATPVKKFGWHSVTLDVNGEKYERSLVVLRPREHKAREFETKGFMFGGWPPGTTHYSLPTYDSCRLAFALGLEAFAFGNHCSRSEIAPLAKANGARDFLAVGPLTPVDRGIDTGRPQANCDEAFLEDALRRQAVVESQVSDPSYQFLFAEPGGIGRDASIAALCGAEVAPKTEAEEARYQLYKTNIVHFARAFRKALPGKKLLVPWGSPLFTVAYLQDPETRDYIDGMCFDDAFFDRLPEGQLHACSLFMLTLFQREWRRYREGEPLVVTIEGPCLTREAPEALSPSEHLRNTLRVCLFLTANGVKHLFANIPYSVDCSSYWGEQHYSDGAFSRLTINPFPVYGACGTLIRILRNCEFVRVVPTGSLGTFALEYRDSRTGQPVHVLWCIRGKVPFTAKARQVSDCMDNPTTSRFATPEPVFLFGCEGEIAFGEQVFDEADTTPAADAVKVGDLAEWTQSTAEPESEYLLNMPSDIRRYPVEMVVSNAGGRLSVCLPEGLPDRDAMPFCTTLVPPKPIVLPDRPKTIALDVETDADWGRVVYVLRDAKGEKFISVGNVETYNVDDPKCESFFNFSGRRLVRFPLPGSRPWDKSHLAGSCFWGASGGDAVVDYPLSLEKIFIERRTKAMYVNAAVEIEPRPALLGALYVEDVDPASDLAMPPPPKDAPIQNPIAEIRGELEPSAILGVTQPTHYYDGTRGHFAFKEMEGAASYDIYVGLKPTGEGAILLKKGAKASGELVTGFRANTEHYAFVVWRDAKGKVSKPSAPFKFSLKDEFAQK